MRARLGAYGLWQLRDFMFERAAAIVIIGLMLVFGTYESMNPIIRKSLEAGGPSALAFGARGVAEHLGLLWFITSLIAVYGISSSDRTTGRFRLIFAKPVRVLPYYAQAFALHGLAFMLCTLTWLNESYNLCTLSAIPYDPKSGSLKGDAWIDLPGQPGVYCRLAFTLQLVTFDGLTTLHLRGRFGPAGKPLGSTGGPGTLAAEASAGSGTD